MRRLSLPWKEPVTGDLLMGIDLGTSSTKVVMIDPEGRVVACTAVEYAVETPHPDWAEQHPQTWVQAAVQAMRDVLAAARVPGSAIAGIGLAGQMHGMVCLDARGQVLRPAIIWADQRSRAQVARLHRDPGAAQLGLWTGNPVAAGFMLPSWLWLCEEEPETARAVAQLLLPKDYLRYVLLGSIGTEPS
ncbi:MAG: FGGY family carbohydrate kinase, partial [Anaerolineae bacterium]|nr:FGGY family carbohydrate kinase [Anaerolineae bacterium]